MGDPFGFSDAVYDAEQAVLGSCLIDREAIASVVEVLPDASAFENARARYVYQAMLKLWARREPCDLITLGAQLEGMKGAAEAGANDVYLFELTIAVPTSVHAVYYARIVRNAHRLRAMRNGYHDALKRCMEDPTLDPAEALSGALGDMLAEPQDGGLRTYADLIPQEQMAIIEEQAGNRGRQVTSTGFTELDRLLNGGFPAGGLIVVGARPGMGKALALDTPLPTPEGWTTMGAVKVGDALFDERGARCTVTAATDVMLNRPCYRVRFSDGSEIVADAKHRWLTSTDRARKGREAPKVVTTAEIAATLQVNADRRRNHSIEAAGALQTGERALPIPPYTLGAWLGDGHSASASITTADPGVLHGIEAEGVTLGEAKDWNAGRARTYRIGGGRRGGDQRFDTSLQRTLREQGLLGNKHIPLDYRRAALWQRRALLAGLMDTDGYVDPVSGVCEFVSCSKRLSRDVAELVASLGWIPSIKRGAATISGREAGEKWRVRFSPDAPVFGLERKLFAQRLTQRDTTRRRYIVAVEPTASVPVRCIQVDSASHLYLAGEGMIPTHNTSFAYELLRAASRRGQALFFSAEMGASPIIRRGLSRETGVPFETLDAGEMDPGQYAAFMDAARRMQAQRILIDDTPGITTDQIELRAQRALANGPVSLLVFDYMELAGDEVSGREGEERRMTKVIRKLHRIGRSLDVPVVALSQVSRDVEHRKKLIPTLSDLRWAASIEQEADQVMFMYRHDYYVGLDMVEHEPDLEGICQIHVSKHRNGRTGVVRLKYDGTTFTFDNEDDLGGYAA